MRQSTQFLALAASLSTASASAIQGLNYGSVDSLNVVRDQANFETNFNTAKNLAGTNGAFTSARLYTMVQGGTKNTPISAIPAAIKAGTTLLLGLWTSGTTFPDELAALKSAIETYGDKLTDLVDGISIGSEDLYRNSPQGIAAGSLIGQEPDVLVDYISQVRKVIAGTSLSGAKIGHVDTWTAWVNGSNAEVINACDWLGFDGYPYWQTEDDNTVENGKSLFLDSFDKVVAVAGSKPVWVTETGWAVTDAKGGQGKAKASADDAKLFWDDVGCGELFGKIPTWWYMLNDANSTPSFGISSSDDNTTPLYNLTCPAVSKDVSSSSSSASHSSTTLSSASSSATASEIAVISASASSAIASLSSVAATATGEAKSSAIAAQTSIMVAASSAASSVVSKASAASKTATTTASTTSSTTSSTSSTNAAVSNIVSAGGLFAVVLAAVFAM